MLEGGSAGLAAAPRHSVGFPSPAPAAIGGSPCLHDSVQVLPPVDPAGVLPLARHRHPVRATHWPPADAGRILVAPSLGPSLGHLVGRNLLAVYLQQLLVERGDTTRNRHVPGAPGDILDGYIEHWSSDDSGLDRDAWFRGLAGFPTTFITGELPPVRRDLYYAALNRYRNGSSEVATQTPPEAVGRKAPPLRPH